MATTHPTNVTRAEFETRAQPYTDRAIKLRGRPFSDVVDASGRQYIDLVLEGGGTLGIALLGYIHVLEQAGLRFIGIGGTSAGAITATVLASAGAPASERGQQLIDVVANMPMASFMDGKKPGDRDAADFVNAFMRHKGVLAKLWAGAQVIDNLREINGLNRGQAFLDWLTHTLAEYNGGHPMTVAALRQRMTDVPELWVTEGALASDFAALDKLPYETLPDGRRRITLNRERDYLCVVAADVSTQSKTEFPRQAKLYWPDSEQVNVAEFARASMSIPGFFAPFTVPSLPADVARPLWKAERVWADENFEGDFLPKQHCFVDGGVLSNFPIAAFHSRSRVPLRPTFGVKLQWDEHKNEVHDLIDVARGAVNSARSALDDDFIDQNPDYSRLVAYIDTGKISWLDFEMSAADKLELFERGARAAAEFLEGFDWTDYKRVRRLLLQARAIET